VEGTPSTRTNPNAWPRTSQGVARYYDSQPIGLKAEYEILETRQIAEDVVLGYLEVDFSFVDRPTITVNLSVLIKGDLIAHYQVSRLS
jgi:hypothetical protein